MISFPVRVLKTSERLRNTPYIHGHVVHAELHVPSFNFSNLCASGFSSSRALRIKSQIRMNVLSAKMLTPQPYVYALYVFMCVYVHVCMCLYTAAGVCSGLTIKLGAVWF